METSYPIHRLRSGDAVAMRKLNELFAEAFDDRESYSAAPPGDAYLEDLLAKEHVIALTASDGDKVAGGLVAYELAKFERARREIYIYDLAVHADHRRRGIATALIDALRVIARTRDVWVIYVQADYGDDPAIALYEKLGKREDVMHFDIAVASGIRSDR
jgi:aminoglycoside 3-N-acetyltransferase I